MNAKVSFKLFLSLSLMFIVLLVTACTRQVPSSTVEPGPSPATSTTEHKPIELRYGSAIPSVDTVSEVTLAWIDKIKKDTNGRVIITPYWGGTLINPRETIPDIIKGVADLGFGMYQWGTGTGYDIHSAMELQFYACPNPQVAKRVYREIYAKFPEVRAEFSKVKILALTTGGKKEQLFTTKKAVQKTADISGLRLRTVTSMMLVCKKLGAEVATVPMGEVYTSTEKNMIDGIITFWDTIQSYKLGDLIKYATIINITRMPYPAQIMNMDTWNKLPPDIQKVFEDNSDWFDDLYWQLALKKDQDAIAYFKQAGGQTIEMSSAELSKLYSTIDAVCTEEGQKLDAKGLPGTKIMQEIRRLISEYSK